MVKYLGGDEGDGNEGGADEEERRHRRHHSGESRVCVEESNQSGSNSKLPDL